MASQVARACLLAPAASARLLRRTLNAASMVLSRPDLLRRAAARPVAPVARVAPFAEPEFGNMCHPAGTIDTVLPEHDSLLDAGAGRYSGVFEKHAAYHLRTRAEVTAVADPGRSDDVAASLDMAARTDVHRPLDSGSVPVDPGVQANPQPVLDLHPRHLQVRHLAQHHSLQHAPVI